MVKIKILIITLLLLYTGCNNVKKNDEVKAGKIEKEKAVKTDNKLTNFVFVGMVGNKPGLYEYRGKNTKPAPLWSDRIEKVIELSYPDNMEAAFFLTAKSAGKSGVFPFVKNVKLYRINMDPPKVSFLSSIGTGLQVYTRWENYNTFKVVLNSFDKKIAKNVNQHSTVYSVFGKKQLDENKVYDIAKDGYPQIPDKPVNLASPGGNFLVNKDESKIEIVNKKNSTEKMIVTETSQKIKQVAWTEDYAIISTIDVSPGNETIYNKNPETSKIIIYSLKDKKVVKQFNGGGLKNFFVKNQFVVFDDGFAENSSIKIYNFIKNEIVDEIKINGGCGLENIPEIPDYSA